MSEETLPVLVMRWFQEGGSGYARDARIDDATLALIIENLAPVFSHPAENVFRLGLPDGRILLGSKREDLDCPDPRAAERRPSIVRVAVLPGPLGPRRSELVRQALEALPLPRTPGPHPSGLRVPLPPTVQVPPPKQTVPRPLVMLLPWLVLSTPLLLGQDNLREAMTHLGMGVVMAGLVKWATPRLASHAEVNRLEQAWCGDLHDDAPFPNSQLVTTQSRLLFPSLEGKTPALRGVAQIQYSYAACAPGSVTLCGQETLHLHDSSSTRCAFVRHYLRSGNHWYLALGQWTPLTESRTGEWEEALSASANSP